MCSVPAKASFQGNVEREATLDQLAGGGGSGFQSRKEETLNVTGLCQKNIEAGRLVQLVSSIAILSTKHTTCSPRLCHTLPFQV